MGNEVTVMAEFADKVRDKVKRDFAEMIPDEAWDKLVKTAVTDFIEKDLGRLVKGQLEAEVVERMTAYFQTAGWKGRWAEYGHSNDASKKVESLIAENLPALIKALFGGAVQNFINTLQFGRQQ